MSYRGFILPVSASDIKSIENLTIEELKQYLLNQQVDCFEGTKGDILKIEHSEIGRDEKLMTFANAK